MNMKKDYITIGDKRYRVEVNWLALTSFLAAIGRDTMEGLSTITELKPSDLPALMAAAIKEGERQEGHECSLTALDLGMKITPATVQAFMAIYVAQSSAMMGVDEAKKGAPQGKAK